MNEVLKRMETTGIVPVVVIENSGKAAAAAKAMLAGGVDIMEITLRTSAGLESIKEVAKKCPETLVGAGTVLALDQCKESVENGARFIVSPGYNARVVDWCLENDIVVIPGCVTPTEITAAIERGLDILKFFPANVYGGLSAMKALAGPFGNIKFIPTGGVSAQNLGEFISASFIHAVGGSWICAKEDISSGSFDKITALCAEARQIILGFEFAHVGINTIDSEEAGDVSAQYGEAFGFMIKEGASSIFAGAGIEVVKGSYLGRNGHIAIKTNDIYRGMDYLMKNGFAIDMETAKYKGDRMIAVYLTDEIGSFAVHLLQK